MKKKGGKILISLVLILALLLPMSLSVFAASVQDEGGSEVIAETAAEPENETDGNIMPDRTEISNPETAPNRNTASDQGTASESYRGSEAETTGADEDGVPRDDSEGQIAGLSISGSKTVEVGKTITLTGAGWSNHVWTASGTGEVVLQGTGKTVSVTGKKAGNVIITHRYTSGQNSKTEKTDITVTAAGTIEAKVYLRYSNAVPLNTLQSYAAGEFGPSGNNIPYITVTVNLDDVAYKANRYSNSSWIYYSIDSDDRYNIKDNTTDAGRKANAYNFWDGVIYPAIEEGDRQALDAIFGSNSFIGYVLKIESDGWHIDGILKEEPPVYVVELYEESNNQALFAISESEKGVPYTRFKKYVEQTLSADSGSYKWVTEGADNLVVKYQKAGVWYQSTITPRNNVVGDSYTGYHVYPEENSFVYRTVTENIYFISRMKIKTEVLSSSLTISKTVVGSAANPKEHFTFTLYAPDADGNYTVTYAGTDGCAEPLQHSGTIAFQNQTATLALKHGESATIQGLTGTVTVKERNGNYKTSYTINGGDKETYTDTTGAVVNVSGVDAAVVFTNELDAQPDTGIHTNAVPGLLAALAAIGAGAVVLPSLKKRERDNA